MRSMWTTDFKVLAATHELHGLVLTLSTEFARRHWSRSVVAVHHHFFRRHFQPPAPGWPGATFQTAELQIRLVRASELNSHLKEMNLAAAGLAHETRNPLNIIRGMAQMLSKQPGVPAESAKKPAPSWMKPTRSRPS